MQLANLLCFFTNQEINARSEVERMERELESARKKLEKVHQRRYQTDSETEQSGYVYFVITHFSNFYAIYSNMFVMPRLTLAVTKINKLV